MTKRHKRGTGVGRCRAWDKISIERCMKSSHHDGAHQTTKGFVWWGALPHRILKVLRAADDLAHVVATRRRPGVTNFLGSLDQAVEKYRKARGDVRT